VSIFVVVLSSSTACCRSAFASNGQQICLIKKLFVSKTRDGSLLILRLCQSNSMYSLGCIEHCTWCRCGQTDIALANEIVAALTYCFDFLTWLYGSFTAPHLVNTIHLAPSISTRLSRITHLDSIISLCLVSMLICSSKTSIDW
jgi:hypothetical protein